MRIKDLFLLLLLFSSLLVNAQQKEIDSLENYYHYSQDAKRMEICLELSALYRNIDPSKGLEFAKEGITLARHFKDLKTEAAILNEMGVLYRKLGELDKAMLYHKDALVIFKSTNDIMGQAYCFSNIASVNIDMGYYEMALEYANRSLELKKKLGDENQIAYSLRIIASIYHESGRYSEALPYYNQAMDYYERLNNKTEKANVMLNKAIASSSLHDDFTPEIVDSLFSQAQIIYERVGSKYGVAAVHFHRADWEVRVENYTAAEQYYLKVLEITKEIDAKVLYLKALEKISEFYEIIGRNQTAYDYLSEYVRLQKELFSESKAKEVASIESRILLREQEQEIDVLEAQQKTRNVIIVMIFVLLIAIVLFLLFFNQRYKEIKRLNNKLNDEVTHRRKSEEKLKESEEQLKVLIEDKNRFLSIISHDLRSPFSGMYGLIYLMEEQHDELSDEKIKEIIDRLSKSSSQINELLEDLLSWANLSSGNIVFKPEIFNATKLINEVVDINTYRLQTKDISCRYDSSTQFIRADYFMVKTVFMNLLTNAIKFSDSNSQIEIEREIIDDRIVFSIIDHGIGMNEDTLKKIQQPGKHVSKSGTMGEKGSGVGLLLVYDLLKKHGSQPEFSSSPGEGTTVKFSLPVK